jgi:hypothetical protein
MHAASFRLRQRGNLNKLICPTMPMFLQAGQSVASSSGSGVSLTICTCGSSNDPYAIKDEPKNRQDVRLQPGLDHPDGAPCAS